MWTLDDGRVLTLYTPEQLEALSDSHVVLDIFGDDNTLGDIRSRNDHTETRGGYTAYGFVQVPDAK